MNTYKFISKINGQYVFAADGEYYADKFCDDEIIKQQGVTANDDNGLTHVNDGEVLSLATKIEQKNAELDRLTIIQFTVGNPDCEMKVVINDLGIAGDDEKAGGLWELSGSKAELFSIGDNII